MKSLAALFLVLIAPLALAQAGIKVTLEAPGKHLIWSAPDLTRLDLDGTLTQESSMTVDGVLSDYILVWNQNTGNVAYKKTREIKGEWKVTPDDYKLIARLSVRLEHEGKPLKTASLKVNGSTPQVLDETSAGETTFELVKAGEVKVDYSFKSGRHTRTQQQSFQVPATREDVDPKVTVSISVDVETLDVPKVPAPRPSDSSPDGATKIIKAATASPNNIGSILMFLTLVGAAVGILILGLRWIRANEDKAKGVLTSLGVQVPDPIDPNAVDPGMPGAPPVTASAPVDPGPPAQIILGNDPAPFPSPVPGLIGTAPAVPRLVGQNGFPFEIPEGETPVGREAIGGLALPGESTVSRSHASLSRSGGTVTLKDLGSTNGTFVNGIKLVGDQTLRPGDDVQFGSVKYRFE